MDDADAIEKAKRLIDHHTMELWNGERLVARLDQGPSKAPALWS
jgi:hypothetical protein